MKQTFLSDLFPQTKFEPQKRKNNDLGIFTKSLKAPPSTVVPTSSIKSLSQTTQSILLSFPPPESLESIDSILSSASLQEKYQDLLESVRSLLLPYSYKRLLVLQGYLDCMINNARMRKLPIGFSNLKQAIECTYSINIDLEHIQRILHVVPELYKLTWTVENGEEILFIDLPENHSYSQFLLHNRNSTFKSELLKIVKKHHVEHLNKIGVKFDPDKTKTWHSTFDLHGLPDLPTAPLPEKSSENPTVVKSSLGKQLRANRLIGLCKIIVEIFEKTKASSLFLNSLVKKIIRFKGRKEEEKHVERDVIELSEIFMNWVCLYKTGSGTVVRINRCNELSLKKSAAKVKQKYGLS